MEQESGKLYYKIGEVCDLCEIQPHVLRYWETEFSQLSPSKNNSGQRVYRYRDLQLVRRIKQLLYEEGYTIAGASKKLATENFDLFADAVLARAGADQDFSDSLGATEQQATAPPVFLEAARSLPEKIVMDGQTRKLLEDIRSQLRSVLEILK